VFIFISFLACGEPTTDAVSTQVETSTRSQAVVNLREPTRPDGYSPLTVSARAKDELSHLLIELEELEEEPLNRALELLNTTTGPCEPCMQQGISTADCLIGGEPTQCGNILGYARYLSDVAVNVEDVGAARTDVTFIEPWQVSVGSDAMGQSAVQVKVGLDLVDPFTPDVLRVVRELESEFGDVLEVTYAFTPLERHPEAREAAQFALSGVNIEMVVSAYGSGADGARESLMQEPGVEARFNSPRVMSGLSNSLTFMDENSVSASPTFWIDGYRRSGAQRVEVLRSMISRARSMRELQ